MSARIPVICESCFMSYQDIAYDRDEDDETREVAAMFMADMGRDVPDHCCDATDEPDIDCDCGCRS